jgi:Bacteriophage tail sheath protein
MVRILSGGGKDSAGKPTLKTIGRPGWLRINARGFRQGARVLSKRDPASAILSVPIQNIMSIGRGIAALTTALTGTNNDLVFTSKFAGLAGNSTRVRYVVAGASTPLSISVSGSDITVNVATDAGSLPTSTASQVMAAVNGDTAARKLVTASLAAGNDGTGVVTALAYTNLTGGSEGEMRQKLPPELAPNNPSPTIIGHEESMATMKSPLSVQRTATVRIQAGRGTNRSIRKG